MQSTILEKQQFFLSCKESTIENKKNFYGCFYIGPFNSGQSLTVANTLRRILLSEISGISITSAIIEGAAHEYSTLNGVQDSILDILLNLKEIVLKSRFPLKEPLYGYIESVGPGIVRACDIKLPFFIQCIDPQQYIATLSENGILKIKVIIQEGKNYQIYNYKKKFSDSEIENIKVNNIFEINKSQQVNPIIKKLLNNETERNCNNKQNQLLIDAIFMPVNRVNYTIESFNNNTKTNNNSSEVIILEIWTNGSLTPRQALYLALNYSNSLFLQLQKMKILHSISAKSMLTEKREGF